jgi:hypothetical protein
MGDRRIFLKNGRDASFNKDLSNEPNFGRIHLAGQYLKSRNNYALSPEASICTFYIEQFTTYTQM